MKDPAQRFGRNLALNPGFETWRQGAVEAWKTSITGASTITEDTSVFYAGSGSVKVITATAAAAFVNQRISIAVGTKVKFKFWLRCSGLLPIRLRSYLGSEAAGTLSKQITVSAINTWEQFEEIITWGANDTGIFFENNSSNYTWWLDNTEVRALLYVPTFDLAGIAAKIQTLQTTLASNLSWLDYSFGVADRYEKLINDETHIIPLCFVDNTTDPVDMRPWPYDTWDSYAFWHVEEPGEVKYSDELGAAMRKYAIWNYSVACIIVADLRKLDDSPYNETKSKLKQDILEVFQNNVDINFSFWITGVFERNINEIFSPYTIEKPEDILKYPIVAFRFEGTLQFKQLCPVANTYSVTTRT